MRQIRIGVSGWNYKPWRGTFYPAQVTQKRELEFASRQVNAIEINGSFYSLKKPSDYRKWLAEVPADFIFCVKAPRYITHIRRLREVKIPMANFFGNGILELGSQLGPILWQLPPNTRFHPQVIEDFLKLLPKDTNQAKRLARKHDQAIAGKCSLGAGRNKKLRHAIEVRHESFRDTEFFRLLKKYNVALVDSDGAGQWPEIKKLVTGFVYVRLHGGSKLYESGYNDRELKAFAKQIKNWHRNRDVFLFFDNDIKARAPFDAMRLLGLVTKFKPEYYVEHPVDRAKIKGLTKIQERAR